MSNIELVSKDSDNLVKSHQLSRRRFLGLSVSAATTLLFANSRLANAQYDKPESLPVGPDAAFPDSSTITVQDLLTPESIELRSAQIPEPKLITDYLGKNPEREGLAVPRFKKYIASAQAYTMGGVAEAANWIAQIVSDRAPKKNTENEMTFMVNYKNAGYSRIGLSATPEACFSESKSPVNCPPTDPSTPIDTYRVYSVDNLGHFFLNHVLVLGEIEADPKNLEHMVRLIQIKEGVIQVNSMADANLTADKLNKINKQAQDLSWFEALKSARTLKNNLPSDYWSMSDGFKKYYEGFEAVYNEKNEQPALDYISSTNIK